MSYANPLVPRRIRGTEHLDDRTLDPALALRSLADVRRANRLFGGTSAVLAELRPLLCGAPRTLTLLDVGTGAGDIPAAARQLAASRGITLDTIGLEWTLPLTRGAAPQCNTALTGDARALPFASRSIDVVTCSQVLHHFDDTGSIALLVELTRVARQRVIVGEIRRSWLAAGGLWLASWPLGFHPVSRHDGVVSVLRGFVRADLGALVRRATASDPSVTARAGFRITASWTPQ